MRGFTSYAHPVADMGVCRADAKRERGKEDHVVRRENCIIERAGIAVSKLVSTEGG